MSTSSIGEQLRRMREALGMSQDELGKIIGVKQQYIAALELGRFSLKEDIKFLIIKAFQSRQKSIESMNLQFFDSPEQITTRSDSNTDYSYIELAAR